MVKYLSGASIGKQFYNYGSPLVGIKYQSGESSGTQFYNYGLPPIGIKYLAGTSVGTQFQNYGLPPIGIKYLAGESSGKPFQIQPPPTPIIKYLAGASTGKTFQIQYPLTLIDLAIQYTKQAYYEILNKNGVINMPLTPKAQRSYRYLLLREMINVGCAEATKTVLEPYKRPICYAILKKAVQRIFNYGKTPEIIEHYNKQLQQLIGRT